MSAPAISSDFDYTTLPAATAARQRKRADRIVSLGRRTVETMGEIGHELLDAQAELEHGTFLLWIEGATGLSKSSAYRFMDMARAFGPKLPTVGSLPPAIVQTLAAKTTPEPVRIAVLRRIEAGETIAPATILSEVREARDEAKASASAEREASRRAALSDVQRDAEDALRLKGEKGRAARNRREERLRAERRAEDRERRAEAKASAVALAERFGIEGVGTFLGMLGGQVNDIAREALILVAVEQTRDAPVETISTGQIAQGGRLYDWAIGPEDMAEATALAAEIERDGLREPLVVRKMRFGTGYEGRYEVLDGVKRFLALNRVLNRVEISVRIAPAIGARADDEQSNAGSGA